MFEKVDVNGTDRHPLYAWLTGQKPPRGRGDITWNFEKFLINTDGTVIARFAPSTDPQDKALIREIERHLSA